MKTKLARKNAEFLSNEQTEHRPTNKTPFKHMFHPLFLNVLLRSRPTRHSFEDLSENHQIQKNLQNDENERSTIFTRLQTEYR